MARTATSKTATYKGRKYRLAWMGQTKYGQRAKLAFWDGSKEFWVDAAMVSVSVSDTRRAPNGECMCGACEDLLSMGYRPGARIRCEECGGWAEAY